MTNRKEVQALYDKQKRGASVMSREKMMGIWMIMVRFLIAFTALFLFSYVAFLLTNSAWISLIALVIVQLYLQIRRYLKETA